MLAAAGATTFGGWSVVACVTSVLGVPAAACWASKLGCCLRAAVQGGCTAVKHDWCEERGTFMDRLSMLCAQQQWRLQWQWRRCRRRSAEGKPQLPCDCGMVLSA